MTDVPRKLTRSQLLGFLREHQAVRTFERMQDSALEDMPSALEDAIVMASTTDARLNEAIGASNRLSEAIESLLAAVAPQPAPELDDLTPVREPLGFDEQFLPTARVISLDDNLTPPSLPLTGPLLAGIIGGSLAANPTGTVGLTPVNGTLSTYLRSDSAPALSQAIAPTWSAQHIFASTGVGIVMSNSAGPTLRMVDTNTAVDQKQLRIKNTNGAFSISSEDDGGNPITDLINTTRAAAVWGSLSFGNATDNPTYSFLGTGTATHGGQITALRYVPTSSTVATNGLYLPSANNPGLSANSTKVIDWTSTLVTITGNLSLGVAGNKMLVKEGANASMGVATLLAGTVVVNTTLVTANSRIFLAVQSLGTVAVATPIAVTARTAGTSFTITSSAITDTSVIAWHIVEPA